MQRLSNFETRDIETLLHPTTHLARHRETGPALIAERGQGIYVYDTHGRGYIEGLAGLWCLSLGYGQTELVEAAREQMAKLPFSHLFGGRSHEPAIALAEKLKEMSPAPTSKVFFTSSGSEANDTQIKLAWYYNNARGMPRKKKIIARARGYHGVTIGSGSLTGLPAFHADFDLPLPQVIHTDCPHYYRYCEAGETEDAFSDRIAHNLESLIERHDPQTIAAFIAEPVMGAGGVIPPPKGYFAKIQAILERHDIQLIADEVICGFGRTGSMFGSQTYGIKPDSVSVAKAITSAYQPLGAVTISQPVYEAMLEESRKIGVFGHGFTYTGHPVACAVALKTLEIYERMNVVAHVRAVMPIFQTRLKAFADHPLVGEARGVGLLGGLELVADKATKKAFAPGDGVGPKAVSFLQQEGVLLRAMGDTIGICPPVIIDGAGVNEMFDCIQRGLDRTWEWVRKEHLE